jgi:hypothetical protein
MATLHASAGRAITAYEKYKIGNVYVEVDVDPVNVL